MSLYYSILYIRIKLTAYKHHSSCEGRPLGRADHVGARVARCWLVGYGDGIRSSAQSCGAHFLTPVNNFFEISLLLNNAAEGHVTAHRNHFILGKHVRLRLLRNI